MLEMLLSIIYFCLFIFLIRKLPFYSVDGISKNAFALVFVVKISFGLIFWAVYAFYVPYHQKADAFMYFDDGKAIYQALLENPIDYVKILLGFSDPSLDHYIDNTGSWNMIYNQGIYNETRTIIRFNAIVDIFSFGNYHIHTIFICFLSLTGLAGIYKTFLPFLTDKKKELFIVVFFLPSVLFWGSGVLKEGLVLFAFGMLVYHVFRLINGNISFSRIAYVLIFAGLLSVTKAYMLLFLFPALAAYAWISKTNGKKPELKFLIVFAICISGVLCLPKFDLPFTLMDKQRQSIYMANGGALLGLKNENKFIYISPEIKTKVTRIPGKPDYCKIVEGVPYVSWYFLNYSDSIYVQHSTDTTTYWIYYNMQSAGSRIEIPFLHPTYTSILKNSPQAFFTAAFRPHFLDAKNPLMLISSIENFFICLFILVCLIFSSKKIATRHLIYFCLSITIMLFVLIGLTTPVLGAVVRYKIPALPFFLIAFLLILDKEKLLKKFPFLKKIIG